MVVVKMSLTDIIITITVGAAVAGIIFREVKRRKTGESTCGCGSNCSACSKKCR